MKTKIICVFIFLFFFSPYLYGEINSDTVEDYIFRMQEYNTNYFISGEPDTKVQFSFKFKVLKKYELYTGYTQTMFWDLGTKKSNPFSELNFNPELYYSHFFSKNSIINRIDPGYAHLSNGKSGPESRSVDAFFIRAVSYKSASYFIPRVEFRLRYVFAKDKTNKDLQDYYGPFKVKLFFDEIAEKIFKSDELYFEYYNGGKYGEDFSKNSIRVSYRFKIWNDGSAPKIFMQYFNGYVENLSIYNKRVETYRMGFSIGGI